LSHILQQTITLTNGFVKVSKCLRSEAAILFVKPYDREPDDF